MVLILKILMAYFKMRLEKVQHEANLKVLKAPSPSPHPAATVGVERIITQHWNSWGGAGRGGAEGDAHIRVINISSQTVSSWAENN